MSNPIQPVEAPPLSNPQQTSETAQRAIAEAAAEDRGRPTSEAVMAALQSTGEKVTMGGRVAEFSYNNDLDVVVIRIYSGTAEPREVVRQIPSEDYLAFAARYRELLGVLFDEQV